MDTIFGVNVRTSPYVLPQPVLSLRHNVPCSDEFRADMDRWLLDLFGKREVAYIFDSRILGLHQRQIFMSPQSVVMLKNCT